MCVFFAAGLLMEGLAGSALPAATPASNDGVGGGNMELNFFAGVSTPVGKESTGFGLGSFNKFPSGLPVLRMNPVNPKFSVRKILINCFPRFDGFLARL
jgi:hypothetical protein